MESLQSNKQEIIVTQRETAIRIIALDFNQTKLHSIP